MDQRDIYRDHAAEYDALVSAEDCEGALLPALSRRCEPAGRTILEVGVGTGRITRLLASAGASVTGFERSSAMLAVAQAHLAAMGDTACTLALAEAEALPVPDGWADAAVAGWVFGHFRYWMPEGWQDAVGRALGEMRRALKPGGTLIVIETQGTGSETPAPPSPELADYYRWLEEAHGFQRDEIRTDYLFGSTDEAATVLGFFFGDAMAMQVRQNDWQRVPECTGIWWRRV